ncbi:glycosyltransferase family 9 protein [Mucilaginibacter celer]|uniref:Lipopolysaccharide heptosyltransferase family protein n=1 Tax=Mucilaginibacter celer TaxID=2305508 RepID=A0A494VLP7_9SPHI|nr:glycosyltransferase family 9 protein [Mucilaginibacter celer]AYL93790.1 lipopolysaccharide heptosyltransferase family protein [Mucilaginibacter celer]
MRQIDHTTIKHVLISRVDAIGDVVLTLPMAAYLKQLLPGVSVSFLGRTYTKPVIETCTAVDEFINYDELKNLPADEQAAFLKRKNIDAVIHVFPNKHVAAIMRQAGIKLRIGTTNRLFHWHTCNRLVKLSRKKSDLHEAQLNLILLRPFGLTEAQSLPEVIDHYHFECKTPLPESLANNLLADKFNLIIHPKSHGSGMEWGLDNFAKLINELPSEKYNVIITGSDKEKALLAGWIKTLPPTVVDMTGKMQLHEFIAFIFHADGLLASGTGPLHVAAAAGINTLGLFPSVRPIHPGRWAPLGKKAGYLESDGGNLDGITTRMVMQKIDMWYNNKFVINA